MATYMQQWPQHHTQMHQTMGHHQFMEQPLQWQMQASLPPHQQLPQHTAHSLPLMHQTLQPPPLRPQNTQSPLTIQTSNQAIPHSQALSHSQQGLSQQLSLPPPATTPLSQQQVDRYNQPVPHQVVGQQGIRGVLPSATGDPSSPDEPCEPEQDEKDGSWPCKCCGKRYRHAKHLRRHHSRHTGETPYECPLCSRRFGRSDVLKRHYHKCATRRGQPVGDHLAGQRGHPRRQRMKNGQMLDIKDDGSFGSVKDDQYLGIKHELGSPITSGPSDSKQPYPPSTHPLDGMSSQFIG